MANSQELIRSMVEATKETTRMEQIYTAKMKIKNELTKGENNLEK